MAIISISHKIGGTLTDADTNPVLSSEGATYGVKRTDTDAVVVADGTAMTKLSTGVYTYTVTEPEAGLTYLYSVELTYQGVTTFITGSVAGAPTSTSSLSGLGCDYTSIRREVGRYLGFDEDVTDWSSGEVQIVNDCISEGLRMFCHPEPIAGRAHEWTFLRPEAGLELTAPYTTGTVTVADGVVTLATGTFPSWAANAVIVISGVGTYWVDSRDSDSQITLEDTSVTDATARTYTLYRYTYDLPTDFGAMVGPITYRTGNQWSDYGIQVRGEHDIRRHFQGAISGGKPKEFALRPAEFNVNLGTRWEIVLWPLADKAYNLAYRYKIDPGQISEARPYPPGGAVHASTIIAACLAAAEQKENDTLGHKTQIFKERLVASIFLDANGMNPDALGYNSDPTPQYVHGGSRRRWFSNSTPITYTVE